MNLKHPPFEAFSNPETIHVTLLLGIDFKVSDALGPRDFERG